MFSHFCGKHFNASLEGSAIKVHIDRVWLMRLRSIFVFAAPRPPVSPVASVTSSLTNAARSSGKFLTTVSFSSASIMIGKFSRHMGCDFAIVCGGDCVC